MRAILIWALSAFLVGIWLAYVWSAGTLSRPAGDPPLLDPNLAALGPVFGAALATNLGAFLGISTQLPRQGEKLLSIAAVGARQSQPWASALAALLYLIGLALAVYFYVTDPEPAKAADVIRNSLLAVGGAALGAFQVATANDK
ncbi:MAG TPA: hypothetical protein VGQ64_03080 [Candidatus Limnocylindrales bacterium]|nr:hypothetical protein [Candidatus Limnocylindrales bacterium]